MKQVFLLGLFLIFFQTSCLGSGFPQEGYNVMHNYISEMKKAKGYCSAGTGASMPYEKIKLLSVSFESSQQANLSKARKLYVEAVEKFIVTINEDTSVRPFLENYPATEECTEVDLSFVDQTQRFQVSGIACVALVCGDVCYRIFNTSTKHLQTIHREPYAKALQVVKGEIPDPYIEPSKE